MKAHRFSMEASVQAGETSTGAGSRKANFHIAVLLHDLVLNFLLKMHVSEPSPLTWQWPHPGP